MVACQKYFSFMVMVAVLGNNYKKSILTRLAFVLMAAFVSGPSANANDSPSLSELAAPCLACHSLSTDRSPRVGPSLAGIAGSEIGADPNYTYSAAFTRKASEGLVWDRDTLDRFLEKPQAVVEGTAMSYPGMPDPAHRAVLLDWLFSDPEGSATELADANFSANPGVQEVMDIVGDAEYGEYLAGECLTCHQMSDNSGRVPPIHNLAPDYFINALLEYQSGTRSNSVMQSISSALGPEEIAALSAVFSQQVSD